MLSQPIVSVCVPQGFSRLIPQDKSTLQTSAPAHDVHGKQSVLFERVLKEQVKSDNIVEHEGIG